MRSHIILCSTRRTHYVIENDIRYDLTPSLIAKLKTHLKTNLRKGEADIVSRWVANLPDAMQKEIRVFPFHGLVA
jgi:hypothetical protein